MSSLAWLALVLSVALPAELPPVAIAQPPSVLSTELAPPPVYDWFDEEKLEELAEVKPKTLLRELRKGRRLRRVEPGEDRRSFKDRFGRDTKLHLYVPKKPVGVLFLLHGLGGSGNQLIPNYKSWAEQNGLIIAAPSARKLGKVKNEDWSSTAENLQHWFSYRPEGFVLSALSSLKREFPIDEDRVYLSGYSMGGFASWNLGLRFPDRFAAAAPIAGGLSQHEYEIERDEKIRALVVNAKNLPFYFIHGDRDQTVDVDHDRKTRDQLRALRYPHEYREVSGGGHILDVRAGTPLMRGLQTWLGKRGRNSHPREIEFHSLGSYMNQAYWIRIDEYEGEGPAQVSAKIGKKNTVEITTEGVKKLTVFIDTELLKLNRKIEIELNGTEAFSGKLKSSSEAIIESWRAREDRQLLYEAMVSLEVPDRGTGDEEAGE